MNVREFQRCAVHITDDVRHNVDKSGNNWTFSAQHRPHDCFTDLQYFEEEKTSGLLIEQNVRKANVEFVQIIVPESS